jgi:hypothetical protein
MDAEYDHIPLHSDIRWLSVGKCLQSFFLFFLFALSNKILLFLQTENLEQEFQKEPFAFLSDLTSHLNVLNLKLQGKGQAILTESIS